MNRAHAMAAAVLCALARLAGAQIVTGPVQKPADNRLSHQSVKPAGYEYSSSTQTSVDQSAASGEQGRELLAKYIPSGGIALSGDPGSEFFDGLIFGGFADRKVTIDLVRSRSGRTEIFCSCANPQTAFLFRKPHSAAGRGSAKYIPLPEKISRNGSVAVYLLNTAEGKEAPYRMFTICNARNKDGICSMLHTGASEYAITMIGQYVLTPYTFAAAQRNEGNRNGDRLPKSFYFRMADGQRGNDQTTLAFYQSDVRTVRDADVCLRDANPVIAPGTRFNVKQSVQDPKHVADVKTTAKALPESSKILVHNRNIPRMIMPADLKPKDQADGSAGDQDRK